MNPGVIGGIIGGLLGVAGGIFGTWCAIKNTKNPKERSFMIKASAIAWIAIALFVVLLLTLPSPYRHLLWIPYAILLPLGIVKANKIQRKLREEAAHDQQDETRK